MKQNVIMTMFIALCVWIIFPALCAGGADVNAKLAPELQDRLKTVGEGVEIKTIIVMADRLDVVSLDREITYPVRAPRREHHEIIVEALKEYAEVTQRELLSVLGDMKKGGLVEEYRGFWIANMVYMKAAKAAIYEVAAREDVEMIELDVPMELVEPVYEGPAEFDSRGAESGLRAIKADSLWALGIMGQGRLVSHLDTGVDGNHPALASRWRGLEPGVTPAEAWFDPVTYTTFPFDSGSHGTHTMGTICGVSGNDTIGVAPQAKWICAAVIDRVSLERTKVDAVSAFQWIADPDGDPKTVDDVPDVCSNSWGFSPFYHSVPKCDNFFWSAVDGCEAAGVAVVFAAGNEGPTTESLRTPADRITTTTNCFSVGALDVNSRNITDFSSRGPSGCDHKTIKPEVCARGENVRSSIPGGSYGTMSGTSMACPHVAGGVALLRQVDPDLTSAQVKEVLMETATDLGTTGEDNNYGWGIINLASAYAVLTTSWGHVEGYVKDANTQKGLPALIKVKGMPKKMRANNQGYYNMGLPGDTTYTIIASCYSYVPQQKSKYVPVEQTVQLDFNLQKVPTGGIAGYVVDDAGKPISGADITIINTPVDPIKTNTQGYYSFSGIPADSVYTLRAVERNHMPATDSVMVEVGKISSLDFVLPAGFYDDVEAGAGEWTHYKIKALYSDEWHLENYRNHSTGGSWSWKCGGTGSSGYSQRLDCALETPPFELGYNSIFTFWHWIETAYVNKTSVYDGGIVEITTDGGTTWTQITPEGGYPYQIFYTLFNPFPAGTPCFGKYNDWKQETFNLASYSGTVSLRFHFGSGIMYDGEGWYIDDIMLYSQKPVTITATPDKTSIPRGGSFNVDIKLKNQTSGARNIKAWADLYLPNGKPYPGNPIAGPVSATLPGNKQVAKRNTHTIPMSAPLGTYRYIAKVESPAGTLSDQDSFEFQVTQ